jgi:hypothetical protein
MHALNLKWSPTVGGPVKKIIENLTNVATRKNVKLMAANIE